MLCSNPTALQTARAQLIGVTMLWGTYTPTVRLIYQQEGCPDPASLTAIRAVVALVALAISMQTFKSTSNNANEELAPQVRGVYFRENEAHPGSRWTDNHYCL